MSKSDDELQSYLGCGCLILAVMGAVVCFCVTLAGGISYSDGFREGHVQKVSKKGVIWKTNEGQMVMPGFVMRQHNEGSSLSNLWEFSADDQGALQLATVHEKELVRLYYHQILFCPPWVSGTGYVVYKVEKLDPVKE